MTDDKSAFNVHLFGTVLSPKHTMIDVSELAVQLHLGASVYIERSCYFALLCNNEPDSLTPQERGILLSTLHEMKVAVNALVDKTGYTVNHSRFLTMVKSPLEPEAFLRTYFVRVVLTQPNEWVLTLSG